MLLKKGLAEKVTEQFYSETEVADARVHFERTVQRRQFPSRHT